LHNPRLLYEGLAKLLLSLDRGLTYAMPVVVIFICLALLIASDPRQLRLAVFAILLLPIYFVVSLLPIALSLPAMMAMADQFYMLLATAGGMFILLLSFLFRVVLTLFGVTCGDSVASRTELSVVKVFETASRAN